MGEDCVRLTGHPVFQSVLDTQCSWHLRSSPLYGIFLCQLTAELDLSWGAALSWPLRFRVRMGEIRKDDWK